MTTELTFVRMPRVQVLGSDLKIEIRINGAKEGDLCISKTSLDFYPSGNTENFMRLQWSQIRSVFEQSGKSMSVKSPKG